MENQSFTNRTLNEFTKLIVNFLEVRDKAVLEKVQQLEKALVEKIFKTSNRVQDSMISEIQRVLTNYKNDKQIEDEKFFKKLESLLGNY